MYRLEDHQGVFLLYYLDDTGKRDNFMIPGDVLKQIFRHLMNEKATDWVNEER
jgi:hypothetical protein